jgi:hypothetical protein
MSWLNRLTIVPLSVIEKKPYGAFRVVFKRSECNAEAVLFMIPMMSKLFGISVRHPVVQRQYLLATGDVESYVQKNENSVNS